MLKRILCVDDDARILQAFERQFRKQFDLQTALGPELGLQAIATDGPFAVVVSDLRMPGMNGIEFLARVRQASPDTTRVMLTGDADLNAAVAAVNEGKISQFLSKPCLPHVFARAIESALEQYRLITAERELLEKTLRGSIGVMSEILGLVNPPAFGRADRIRRYVQHITEQLRIPDAWQYEMAALLSQIGCVTIPTDVLDKFHAGEPLSSSERRSLLSQAEVGYELLARIPRLENIAKMIAQQYNPQLPLNDWSDPVRVGSNLLKVGTDFDEQLVRGVPFESILANMRQSKSYDRAFVAALRQVQVEEAKRSVRALPLRQLTTQMIINNDVLSKTGLLLMAKGQQITDSALARLSNFAQAVGVAEPISVILPHRSERKSADVSDASRTAAEFKNSD